MSDEELRLEAMKLAPSDQMATLDERLQAAERIYSFLSGKAQPIPPGHMRSMNGDIHPIPETF